MEPGRPGSQPCKDLMLVISKQTKGTSKCFMVAMSVGHLRKVRSSVATVAKEKRWVGEVDNGHLRWDFVNHAITAQWILTAT